MRARPRWTGLTVLTVLTGCAGLIGVPDLVYETGAGQDEPDAGTRFDASGDGESVGMEAGADAAAPPCNPSTVANDPDHCGRCGHSCLGGDCVASKCKSVVLQSGLQNPTALTVDAANVYVSARGSGTVLRIAKDGSKTDILAQGQDEVRGVALDGTSLFWSNDEPEGDGGNDDWGGVFGCTLPACADKRLVTLGYLARNVRAADGVLYFAERNAGAIVRVNPDGSGRMKVASRSQPFSLAVDATHVYFQASSNFLERALLDGGSQEEVGPLQCGTLGFVALDAERVYWACHDSATRNGFVRSAAKATPGTVQQYGTSNKGSLGVAVDEATLYWTNEGTFSGATSQTDGELLACPKAGCAGAPEVLEQGLLAPGAIVVDGDAIYFVTFGSTLDAADGELRRIAKP